jgi:thioredoxin-dependent peroxiredoxin
MAVGKSKKTAAGKSKRTPALKEGDKLPRFSVTADDGSIVTADSLKGRNTVLYFYPKDDTSGCTKEACEFRDAFPRFSQTDARIIGVSPDNVASHVKFKAKYDLPFQLLADEKHSLAESMGVWKEKSMYGRKFMGVERTTVVVDADGRIARIFPKVSVAGHVAEVEDTLRELARSNATR